MFAPRLLLLTCTVGPLAPYQEPVANPVTDFGYPRFGRAVCVLDDLDGDGFPEIAVGASRASTEQFEECGAVLIFSGADLELLRRVDGPWTGLETGTGLCPVGDLDGDGCRDLLVLSAWGEMTRVVSPRTGATIWSHRPTRSERSWIPRLLDEDGDGFDDHLVRCDERHDRDPWDVVSGRTGEVLGRKSSDWRLRAQHWRSGIRALFRPAAVGAGFDSGRKDMMKQIVPYGFSREQWGQLDFDGDGQRDLVVGLEVRSALDGSLMHVWSSEGFRRRLPEVYDNFGETMVFPGDLDGDGHDDCVIGAPGMFDDSLYAFSGAGAGELIWRVRGTGSTRMGTSLAVLPDRDGDRVAELLVGGADHALGSQVAPGTIWILSGRNARELFRLEAEDVEGLCDR